MSAGLALSETISPVKPITSVPFHIFTKISVVPRGHIYVHLWIDNAHVFSVCTVSSGAPTGPHSDIPMFPLAHRCERCDWSTDLVRCLLLFVDTRFKLWPNVTNKITSTPLNIFFKVTYWKIYHMSKNAWTIFRVANTQTISQNKKENHTLGLGIESKNVKNLCFLIWPIEIIEHVYVI